MKKIAFYCHAYGIGDLLSTTPTLKKVIKAYPEDTEFDIFTYHSYMFKHHPILNSFSYEEFSKIGYDEVFELFSKVVGVAQNKYDAYIKHNQFDIRQITAAEFGFTLLPDEMTCEYFPDKFDNTKFKLPEKYIVMHCAQTWSSRTWPEERWQKLISRIEGEKNIPIVLVGKKMETDKTTDPTKVPFVLDLSLGVDLVSKTTFDETWHIINNSMAVITNDSGILHIAGTTDVEIFYIGGSINPKLRMPYRKGSQEYKTNFIGGVCDIFCASDPKYSILEHGNFHSVPPLIHCLESYEKHGNKDPKIFECHPIAEKVFDVVKKFIPDELLSYDSIGKDTFEFQLREVDEYFRYFDVNEGDVVVDLGACLGLVTLKMLERNPNKVYCVEASDLVYKDLCENVKSYDNVILCKLLIGEEKNITGIFSHTDEKVDILSFYKFVKQNSIDKIDFLKMDIEGAEYEIFNDIDSTNWIKDNVKNIAGEIHIRNRENERRKEFFDLVNKIKNMGFDLIINSVDGIDITEQLINNYFLNDVNENAIDYYTEVNFYAVNNHELVRSTSSFPLKYYN